MGEPVTSVARYAMKSSGDILVKFNLNDVFLSLVSAALATWMDFNADAGHQFRGNDHFGLNQIVLG